MRERRLAYHSSRGAPGNNWSVPTLLPRDLFLAARIKSTLLVEEKRTSTRLIRDLLLRLGFNDIEAAHNAEDALGMLKQKRYGLVLADWNLDALVAREVLKVM